MVYSSPTGTVGSLAPSTHTVFGNTFYSSSIYHCGLKLSIKLQENNYPIWNQKVEGVIFTHRVHKIVANPHIPPKFKTEQDHIDGNVYAEYEAWIVQDQVVLIWLFATISKSVLHCVLACKHAFVVWDKNYCYLNSHMKACVRQLLVELKSMKKGNKSLTEYVLSMQSIANSILAVGDSITEQDQIDSILDDLTEEYNSFDIQMYGSHDSNCMMFKQFFMCKKLRLISSYMN